MARWPIPPDLHTRTIGGPLCPHAEHSIGSRDGRVPRYDDSHACVRCIAGLTEGRLSLDVHKIEKTHRRRFLEFWSYVEIRGLDECWPGMARCIPRAIRLTFRFRDSGIMAANTVLHGWPLGTPGAISAGFRSSTPAATTIAATPAHQGSGRASLLQAPELGHHRPRIQHQQAGIRNNRLPAADQRPRSEAV